MIIFGLLFLIGLLVVCSVLAFMVVAIFDPSNIGEHDVWKDEDF